MVVEHQPWALEVVDVHKRFGGTYALAGVSFGVPRGTVTGLIGPNGSGKTTLLRCIAGFVQPDRGTITIGEAQHARAEDLARIGVAQTFQRIALADDMTVAENVILALDGQRVRYPTRFIRDILGADRGLSGVSVEAVVDALALTNLEEYADRLIGGLPVGVRRRVELARAIVAQPSLLLLDEPTSGLDRHESREIVELLKDLNQRTGMTMLLVEHDMTVIGGGCEHVVVLEFGKVLAQGETKAALTDPRVRDAYLGKMVREFG